jgi:hypothetical protein
MSLNIIPLNGEGIKFITNYIERVSTIDKIGFGVAISYAVQNSKYHHIPFAFINPIAYLGYHSYKHHTVLVNWLRATLL